MNQELVEKRAREAQDFGSRALKKFSQKLQAASKETLINCIKTFFNIAEDEPYERRLDEEARKNIENNLTKLRSFARELCIEAINRDFCSYISTGERGIVGQTVYNSLK